MKRLYFAVLLAGLGCARRSPPASNETTMENVSTAPPADSTRAYTVKKVDLQCFAPPCPAYEAVADGAQPPETLLIHALDLTELKLSEQELASLHSRAETGTLRVKASLETQTDAGPGGEAISLHVRALL